MAVLGIKPAVAFKINEKNESNQSAVSRVFTQAKYQCVEDGFSVIKKL